MSRARTGLHDLDAVGQHDSGPADSLRGIPPAGRVHEWPSADADNRWLGPATLVFRKIHTFFPRELEDRSSPAPAVATIAGSRRAQRPALPSTSYRTTRLRERILVNPDRWCTVERLRWGSAAHAWNSRPIQPSVGGKSCLRRSCASPAASSASGCFSPSVPKPRSNWPKRSHAGHSGLLCCSREVRWRRAASTPHGRSDGALLALRSRSRFARRRHGLQPLAASGHQYCGAVATATFSPTA